MGWDGDGMGWDGDEMGWECLGGREFLLFLFYCYFLVSFDLLIVYFGFGFGFVVFFLLLLFFVFLVKRGGGGGKSRTEGWTVSFSLSVYERMI